MSKMSQVSLCLSVVGGGHCVSRCRRRPGRPL